MKKVLFIFLFFSGKLFAQTADSVTSIKGSEPVLTKAEKIAVFSGGVNAWKAYLDKNLDTTLAAKYLKPGKRQEVKQIAAVQFVVDKEGNVSDVKVINKHIHPKLAEEAIRLIKESPQWVPAEQNGKKVSYQVVQYITFGVSKKRNL